MELEFVQSQTKQWVPIVNGVLVHSSVDPQKEAKSFVDQEWLRLSEVRSLIVFGLGGGFHINELLSRKNFNIVVVESEKSLVSAMQEKSPQFMEKIEVLAGATPVQLSHEATIVNAMNKSYALLKHPASLRISPFYYSSVIQMLNERTLYRLKQLTSANERLFHFFNSLDISKDQILTLPMVEEALKRRGSGLEREGLIWMTMRELII